MVRRIDGSSNPNLHNIFEKSTWSQQLDIRGSANPAV